MLPLLGACPQSTRSGLGIKHNPRLIQNPRLDALMVQPQQRQRAHHVVLFSDSAELVAQNLRHYADRYLQPLGQALEGSAQGLQGEALSPPRLQHSIFTKGTSCTNGTYPAMLRAWASQKSPLGRRVSQLQWHLPSARAPPTNQFFRPQL